MVKEAKVEALKKASCRWVAVRKHPPKPEVLKKDFRKLAGLLAQRTLGG